MAGSSATTITISQRFIELLLGDHVSSRDR